MQHSHQKYLDWLPKQIFIQAVIKRNYFPDSCWIALQNRFLLLNLCCVCICTQLSAMDSWSIVTVCVFKWQFMLHAFGFMLYYSGFVYCIAAAFCVFYQCVRLCVQSDDLNTSSVRIFSLFFLSQLSAHYQFYHWCSRNLFSASCVSHCTLWTEKKTWQYICDHNSGRTHSIFIIFALL